MSSEKLFLIWNDIDGKYKVVDKQSFPYGDAHEVLDAIASARTVTDKPIIINENYAGFDEVIVSEKPKDAIEDTDSFISALAEIAGMKVTKLFNDELNFIGYTMEVKE